MTATRRTTYVPTAINACLAEYQADLLYLATDNAAAELTRLEAFLDDDTNEGDRRER